jgi:hypothetical protein
MDGVQLALLRPSLFLGLTLHRDQIGLGIQNVSHRFRLARGMGTSSATASSPSRFGNDCRMGVARRLPPLDRRRSTLFEAPYILRQTLCILTGLVLILFACSRPQALSALFGPKGVQAALWCVFLSLALFRFFPVGSAAALMGAWLLGVSIIVARTACSIAVPANLAQWWQKWRWALIMAALPTAVLLLFRDLSPAFVFLVILIGAFEAFGQRRAAFWLTMLGLTIPTLGYFLAFLLYSWSAFTPFSPLQWLGVHNTLRLYGQ